MKTLMHNKKPLIEEPLLERSSGSYYEQGSALESLTALDI